MNRVFATVALVLVAFGAAALADNPKEATGFFGEVTGSVKSAEADGTSFVLTVKSTDPDTAKNKADTAGMVGKDLVIGTRLPRDKDGKPHPSPVDVAYVKTLKPGMEITVTLFAARADPTVLRFGVPGKGPNDQPATMP